MSQTGNRRSKSAMRKRTPFRPLPVATPRPLPCDAAPPRVPSRDVSSFFGKAYISREQCLSGGATRQLHARDDA